MHVRNEIIHLENIGGFLSEEKEMLREWKGAEWLKNMYIVGAAKLHDTKRVETRRSENETHRGKWKRLISGKMISRSRYPAYNWGGSEAHLVTAGYTSDT